MRGNERQHAKKPAENIELAEFFRHRMEPHDKCTKVKIVKMTNRQRASSKLRFKRNGQEYNLKIRHNRSYE